MKIYRNNIVIYDIRPEDVSTQRCVHMGENVLNIVFKVTKPLVIRINDYVLFDNEKYKFKKLVQPSRESEHEFEYITQLYSPQYDLQDVIYRLYDNTGIGELDDTIPIYGTLTFIATQIMKCVHAVHPEWSLGTVADSGEGKNITFTDMDCLQSIQHIATEFGVEYWFTGTTLHFGKRKQGTPLKFKYGKENSLYKLSRQNQDGRIVTRLFVKGSDRNIDSFAYGNKHLLLPGKVRYVERNVEKYGVIEGRMPFPEVYPRLIHKNYYDPGSVTSVRVDGNGVYWPKDQYLDFNPSDYLLPGKRIKVCFQTGQLAGTKIDANWHPDTGEFELIRGDYGLGQDIPGSIFIPKVGDLYIFEDIKMPASYVLDAELELQQKSNEAISQICEQKVSYKGPVNPVYFKKLKENIQTGRAVDVEDKDIVDGTGTASLRIISFTRPINNLYNIDIEISDTVYVSRIDKIETEIKDVKDTTEKKFKDTNALARRTWRDIQETNEMIYDPEGYLTERIKALSVQATQLIIGMNSSQFDFVGVKFKPNYGGDFNDFRWDSGQLVHYTVKPNQATYWNISAGNVYLNSAYSYYVYARCPKNGNNGTIKVSITPILLESEPDYWNFWVGVINTPYTMTVSGGLTSTTRSFQTLHGFTEIAGDNITTGIIKSADGKTWFNLKTGEICGNITFLAGSKGWENIQGLLSEFNDLWEGLGDVNDLAVTAKNLADLAQIAANKADEKAAAAQAILDTHAAIVNNFTKIYGGLILTSSIRLLNNGVEQAGMSADLGSGIAYWAGGTLDEAIRFANNLAGKKATYVVTHSGKLFATDVDLIGKIVATSGEFAGSLKGVIGTFRELNSIDQDGNVKGSITFSQSDGKMSFSGDMQHQGYDYINQRSYRFLTSQVWCRSSFGTQSSNAIYIQGNVAYYYTDGLYGTKTEQITLQQLTTSLGETYFVIPLYGATGDATGFPVDLVILNSPSSYNYLLSAAKGKKVTVINSNDASPTPSNIFCMGKKIPINGGGVRDFIYIKGFYTPVLESALGEGWFYSTEQDNNWK